MTITIPGWYCSPCRFSLVAKAIGIVGLDPFIFFIKGKQHPTLQAVGVFPEVGLKQFSCPPENNNGKKVGLEMCPNSKTWIACSASL